MRKIAFLLAGLSLAGVTYAKEVLPEAEPVIEPAVVVKPVEQPVEEIVKAPVLRVTSVGQYLEIDNNSSSNGENSENIGEGIHFGNKVGLAYGDNWTFDLMARKTWKASTDDVKDTEGTWDGVKSNGHRIEIGATRHFDNFAVGLKWRGEEDLDRFYIPVSYDFGIVSGWATPAYTFMNEGNDDDTWYLEAMPLTIKYGPLALGYYFEGTKSTGDDDTHEYDHQVRLMADLFSTDRFRLGAEYWYQFAYENQTEKAGKLVDYYENNKHTGVIKAAYDVTENLTIDGYYRYDFNKYDEFEGATKLAGKDDDYYGEFYLGWTYNF